MAGNRPGPQTREELGKQILTTMRPRWQSGLDEDSAVAVNQRIFDEGVYEFVERITHIFEVVDGDANMFRLDPKYNPHGVTTVEDVEVLVWLWAREFLSVGDVQYWRAYAAWAAEEDFEADIRVRLMLQKLYDFLKDVCSAKGIPVEEGYSFFS